MNVDAVTVQQHRTTKVKNKCYLPKITSVPVCINSRA